MTDGSARVLELFGTVDMKEKILPRLTSRDPNIAITSGQWMTEVSKHIMNYLLILTLHRENRWLRRLSNGNHSQTQSRVFVLDVQTEWFQMVLKRNRC